MPAINAIQLSCAERLIDHKVVECYINPATGLAEFKYIGRDQPAGTLDVRYSLPADQYTPKVDIVVVTGYDPPAYRWFGDSWIDMLNDENKSPDSPRIICPEEIYESCGGAVCVDDNWKETAYVSYVRPLMVESVLAEKLGTDPAYTIVPPYDSLVGFIYKLDHSGGEDNDITHSDTSRCIVALGQYFAGGDIRGGDRGGPSAYIPSELSECGIPLGAPARTKLFTTNMTTYNPHTNENEGDIESLNQIIWMGNRVSACKCDKGRFYDVTDLFFADKNERRANVINIESIPPKTFG